MNWKLIFTLSLIGLAMAIATISLIPNNIEPFFWLVIIIVCAIIIARKCTSKYFLHGFLLSLANCVWIILFHVLYFKTYMMDHPQMKEMNAHMPLAGHIRLQMIVTGPFIGVSFGLIMGLFAFIASKIFKKK